MRMWNRKGKDLRGFGKKGQKILHEKEDDNREKEIASVDIVIIVPHAPTLLLSLPFPSSLFLFLFHYLFLCSLMTHSALHPTLLVL